MSNGEHRIDPEYAAMLARHDELERQAREAKGLPLKEELPVDEVALQARLEAGDEARLLSRHVEEARSTAVREMLTRLTGKKFQKPVARRRRTK